MKTTLFGNEFQVEIKDFDTFYMIALKGGRLTINVKFIYKFNNITGCCDVDARVHSEEIANILLMRADDSSALVEFLNETLKQNNHIQELVELIEEKFNENISKESNIEDEYKIFYKSIKQVFETEKIFS